MLTSLALLILLSLILKNITTKLHLPPLLGMLLVGMLLGPYALNILDDSLLSISYYLRQLALIIILTRAGLSLNIAQLKQIGKPALLMSFVPALCEISAYTIFATIILSVSITDALLIGSVMAAVSPAVIVPRMIKLKEEGYDNCTTVPSLITASSSVDDVVVIVLFTAFLSMASSGTLDLNILWQIPTSILLGIIVGIIVGKLTALICDKLNNNTVVLILMSVAMLLLWLQDTISATIPYSALLSIITMAIIINNNRPIQCATISAKYNSMWSIAEILLFCLIGAEVDISYALENGMIITLIILLCLLGRMIGVAISLIGSKLSIKEKIFCAFAYTPKATVQAAIGGVALAMALPIGNTVLSFAVIGILLTAPLGALLIDTSYKHLLPPCNHESQPTDNNTLA